MIKSSLKNVTGSQSVSLEQTFREAQGGGEALPASGSPESEKPQRAALCARQHGSKPEDAGTVPGTHGAQQREACPDGHTIQRSHKHDPHFDRTPLTTDAC